VNPTRYDALEESKGQYAPAVSGDQERPSLASEVELVGQLDAVGFESPQFLVRRGEGFLQLSELLYHILEQVDGRQSVATIAAAVRQSSGRSVSSDDVAQLIETKLVPMNLVGEAPGAPVFRGPADSTRSPLQINFRVKVRGDRIDPLARALTFLHKRWVLLPLLVAIAVAHVWVFATQGITAALRELLTNPDLILVVLPIILLAAVFHEFGHASALRFEGGRARAMGAGFYLVYPALYTDVTDGYRLGRRARLRVDLGGPYFHLVFALGLAIGFLVTGQPFLLVAMLLVDLEVLRQFLPLGRLDGYWVLADLTGVPDFFSQIVPFFARILPIPVPEGMALPRMKPLTRRILVGYIAAFAVGFPIFLFYTLSHLPALMGAAWSTLYAQADAVSRAWTESRFLVAAGSIFQILFLFVEVAGLFLFFYVLGWLPGRKIWEWTKSEPSALRRMSRASLFVFCGGLLIAVSALYPWISLQFAAAGFSQDFNGVFTAQGRLVFVLGILAMIAALFMFVAWHPTLRRGAPIAALLCALGALAIAGYHLAHAPGLMEDRVREMITTSTGRAPTSQELDAVRSELRILGFTMQTGYGVFLLAVASLTASIAALLGTVAGLRGLAPQALDGITLTNVPPITPSPGAEAAASGGRSDRRFRALSLGLAAMLLAAALAFVALVHPGPHPRQEPSTAEPAPSGRVLWGPNTAGLRDRLAAIGFPALSAEALQYHTHQHLDLYVNGDRVMVPRGIGIDQSAGVITVLHTHETDGIIHVESPVERTFTLGQFFRVWGVPLSSRCIGTYCERGDEHLTAYVNGRLFTGNPARIVLTQHEEIVLSYGTASQQPQVIPASYQFPPGE
jgi:putative peptide zinc metalloprotease protein